MECYCSIDSVNEKRPSLAMNFQLPIISFFHFIVVPVKLQDVHCDGVVRDYEFFSISTTWT